MNNVRQVGLSLAEFDAEYGRFPDASTISAVKAKTGTSLTLDVTSSNKLFRQLLAHGLKSEKPFWAMTRNSPRKPDDIFNADNKALMPGECAFSYITGLSSKDDPATPIVMVPLLKGTTNFDRTQYRGKAIILFLDNSAKALPIDQYGRVAINGMDLFDPRQPFWKGKAPDIKWPE